MWVWEAKTSPKFPGGFSATSHMALVLPPETVAFDDMHPNGQVGIAMLELNGLIYGISIKNDSNVYGISISFNQLIVNVVNPRP